KGEGWGEGAIIHPIGCSLTKNIKYFRKQFLRIDILSSPLGEEHKYIPLPLGRFSKYIPLTLGRFPNTSLSLWERLGEGFLVASHSCYAAGVPSPNLPHRGRDYK
ncbi:MAG: hypothetical protein IJR56_01850, partial [Bacteroidaceae bacterium]|nr:hypothetical protein [Bacteroidaceae bacterium]